MADTAEAELIELVSREQKGLRRIMMAGIAALLLVVLMSAGLGIYYFTVAQKLASDSETLRASAERLERQAFETRRSVELQSDRLARQERAIGRAYEDIRALLPVGNANDAGAALKAAQAYLETGAQSLLSDRIIERAAQQPNGARSTFLQGVDALVRWEQLQNQIGDDSGLLKVQQDVARARFSAIADNATLGRWGRLGLAAVDFRVAQAAGYSRETCEPLIAEIEQIGEETGFAPQALYWMAQCERKLGRPVDALDHYAQSLNQSRLTSGPDGQPVLQNRAELTMEMNAFHGLGTVLIATRGVDGSERVETARALARELCEPASFDAGLSERPQLAYSCLQQAIALRKQLGQTPRQVVGSGENLSFVYLSDDKEDRFEKAFAHAQGIEEDVGLFAWNELMRAVSAHHVGDAAAEQEARRHVALFDQKDFNLCEMRVLLDEDLFAEAKEIVQDRLDPDPLDCNEGI